MSSSCRALMAGAAALLLGAPTYAAKSPAAEHSKPEIVSQVGNPRITILQARLAGGRLFIKGFASAPNTVVSIEGTPFQVLAHPGKTFTLIADHRTPDCRITLTTRTGTLDVLIEDCAPGTVPRGAWSTQARYEAGDLVLFNGTTYLARRDNSGQRPNANPDAWRVFAPQGLAGPIGPRGAMGPRGRRGAIGPEGQRGAIGQDGDEGRRGAVGDRGAPGLRGQDGPPGLNPRGPWSASQIYAQDDLVLFGGSSFRARRTTAGDRPDTSGADWQMFAQGGDKGPPGADGERGPPGAPGQPGQQGSEGPQGQPGSKGDPGPQGEPGERGPPGATGAAGEPGTVFTDLEDRSKVCNGVEDVENNGEGQPEFCVAVCEEGEYGVFGLVRHYRKADDFIEAEWFQFPRYRVFAGMNPSDEPVSGVQEPEVFAERLATHTIQVTLLCAPNRPDPPDLSIFNPQ